MWKCYCFLCKHLWNIFETFFFSFFCLKNFTKYWDLWHSFRFFYKSFCLSAKMWVMFEGIKAMPHKVIVGNQKSVIFLTPDTIFIKTSFLCTAMMMMMMIIAFLFTAYVLHTHLHSTKMSLWATFLTCKTTFLWYTKIVQKIPTTKNHADCNSYYGKKIAS